MTLRERIIRAGTWTLASHAADIITRFISSLIMTRLLVPDAFGLVAAAMALIVGLQLVSDFGVRAVIIRSPRGEDDQFLRSAWSFQVARGVMVWIVLGAVCAVLLIPNLRTLLPQESVYANSQFSYITIALGLGIIFGGLESASISLNVRRLNFGPIFIIDFISRAIPLPVMIALVYLNADVWAIVGGTLSGGLARAVLSHSIVPGPRMSFSYRPDHLKEIVSFGKWINLSSFATFIGSQSDYIIFGFLLSPPVMGLYYLAKTLKDGIESLLERLSGTMMLPILGEVTRNNPANISDRYYRFRLPIELIATISGGFLFASADAIVHFLYDPRYHDAGLMLRILSISLLLYPFILIRSAFTAIGEPHVVAWVSVVQAISFVAGLVTGYFVAGPTGGIAGGVLSRLVPSLVILVLAHRKHWTVISKELRSLPASGLGLVGGQVANYVLGPYTLTDLRHLLAL